MESYSFQNRCAPLGGRVPPRKLGKADAPVNSRRCDGEPQQACDSAPISSSAFASQEGALRQAPKANRGPAAFDHDRRQVPRGIKREEDETRAEQIGGGKRPVRRAKPALLIGEISTKDQGNADESRNRISVKQNCGHLSAA